MSKKEKAAENNSCGLAARRGAVGGQAIVEGVMMRGPKSYAVAVRKPDGEIIIDKKDFKEKKYQEKDGFHYIAVDKNNGITYNDYMNNLIENAKSSGNSN